MIPKTQEVRRPGRRRSVLREIASKISRTRRSARSRDVAAGGDGSVASAEVPDMEEGRHERLERILQAAVAGERDAQEKLFETVYTELRVMARRQLWKERPNHSWQPTELVHLVFLKLFTGKPLAKAQARYFYAAVRNAMRELLIDHARKRKAMKRPDAAVRVPLDYVLDELEAEQRAPYLDLHVCLEKLKELSARQHAVVELRYLVGLPWKEIAAQLGVSVPTVEKDWQAARAWLRSQLDEGGHDV